MRLEEISVRGLLGKFSYRLRLHDDERVTIMHGPNGYGKTTLLRMIDAFYRGDYNLLQATTFESLELGFSDDVRMIIHREITTPASEDGESQPQIVCELRAGDLLVHRDPMKRKRSLRFSRPHEALSRYVPFLRRVGPSTWEDVRDGEVLHEREVLARYEDHLPPGVRPRKMVEPEWLTEHKEQFKVRFIQSQRLLLENDQVRPGHVTSSQPSRFQFTVNAYARELGSMIERKIAEYGALTASYERSFPERFVAQDESLVDPARATALRTDIRTRLEEIEKKRARLQSSGLLDRQVDIQLSLAPGFSDAKLVFLDLYTRDVQTKLDIFDELAEKIALFTELLNRKFSYKKISIARQKGFVIDAADIGELQPQDLSSGEQHELVLCFELLFKTGPGFFVMIDEPEISLHVEWQETFLEDLQRIANLAKFDSLIATHSPIIVGNRWDLAVNLSTQFDPVFA
ncbi:MAG: AAA family ATPase [Bryobacteraceae bacterium]